MNKLYYWIGSHYGYPHPLTHLKLQKLCFYCYGALLAHDLEDHVGKPALVFEPWEHGPVNRDLYFIFANRGAAPLKPEDYGVPPNFPEETTSVRSNICIGIFNEFLWEIKLKWLWHLTAYYIPLLPS